MKATILCNGFPPDKSLIEPCIQSSDLYIAADGGGNTARSYNLLPEIVIGDLDSFKRQPGDNFEVIEDPGQETNDLEKALLLAIDRGVDEVVVFGATGERLDQTLKNLSVMQQFNSSFNKLVFRDNFGESFIIPRNFEMEMEIGQLVSLFPISGRVDGVVTDGLKYPLKDETLENGVRDGTSNEVISSPVKIHYKSGDLLLFAGTGHRPK